MAETEFIVVLLTATLPVTGPVIEIVNVVVTLLDANEVGIDDAVSGKVADTV